MNLRRLLTGGSLLSLTLVLLTVTCLTPCLAADFNRDGYADLAIGVNWEDVGGIHDAGAVNVLYGIWGGIASSGDQIWDEDDLTGSEGSEDHDYFGQTLTAGDFDAGHKVDLAVGIRNEDVNGHDDAGAVQIMYGSNDGISAADNRFFHQDSQYIEGAAEYNDHFVRSLAAIAPRKHVVYVPALLRRH